MSIKWILLSLLGLLLFGLFIYNIIPPQFNIPKHWMDHPSTQDPSLSDPTYLVSTRFEGPLSDAQLNRPVFIAVHGFSASTYEWDEFRTYAESHGDALVSQILLGGHGRSYQAFKKSKWRQWAAPIKAEYEALINQGYQNINFVTASTGGTLLINLLSQDYFKHDIKPNQIIFIDALLKPKDKLLYLVPFVRLFLKDHVIAPKYPDIPDVPYWYHVRSHNALHQLVRCIQFAETKLLNGIILPTGTTLTLFQADEDQVVDPESVYRIQEGIRGHNMEVPQVNLVNSGRHVFTRLKGAAKVSAIEKTLQKSTFKLILGLSK